MPLTLNTNLSSIEQLHNINQMAHSSGLRTSGNIGLIGTQVVKFNTHLSERLNMTVTDAMRDSSNALRETLHALIGSVLTDPADAGLKDKLFAKLDAGGDRALLERKVVAKVLDELGGHAGLEGVRLGKGRPIQSSKGLATDFEKVRADALTEGRSVCEAEMKCKITNMARTFFSNLADNGFKPALLSQDFKANFKNVTDRFAEEYARLNVDVNQLDKPVPQDSIRSMFALLARSAGDGQPFPVSKDTPRTLSENVNEPMVDCFADLTRFRTGRDVGRLMAHFEFSSQMDVALANVILAKTPDLGKGELTRNRIFELLTGEPPARNANLDALSQKDFLAALDTAYQNHLVALCRRPGIKDPETAALNLRGMTTGAMGLVLSEETALKVLAPGKDGIHLTQADLKACCPAYNTQKLSQQFDRNGMISWMRQEIPRDRSTFCVKGDFGFSKKYDEKTYDFHNAAMVDPNKGRLSEDGTKLFDQFKNDFERLDITPKQRLVAGVAMSQAGMMIQSALPVGGPASRPSPSFALREWSANGDLTLDVTSGSPDGKGPSLKFSYSIDKNGESQLISLDYTVPPQEEARPQPKAAPAPQQAPQQAKATGKPSAPQSPANQKLKQAAADSFVEEALTLVGEHGFNKKMLQSALNRLLKVGNNVDAFGSDVDFIKIRQVNSTCTAMFNAGVAQAGHVGNPEQAMRRIAQNLAPKNSYSDYLSGVFNQLADQLRDLQAMNDL